MSRAAVVWSEAGRPRAVALAEDKPLLIGRWREAGVQLHDRAVSRRHARLYARGDGYVIEQLSEASPTWVDHVELTRSLALTDGAAIHLGEQRLVFHDLAAGDRVAGSLCSYCDRENTADDRYCWYCGTGMAAAATAPPQTRRQVCRLVGAGAERFDLYPNETWALIVPGGRMLRRGAPIPAEAAVVVTAERQHTLARLGGPGAQARINNLPLLVSTGLGTGDLIESAGTAFVALVR